MAAHTYYKAASSTFTSTGSLDHCSNRNPLVTAGEMTWGSHLCPLRSTEEEAATSAVQSFNRDTRSRNKQEIMTLPMAHKYSEETDPKSNENL